MFRWMSFFRSVAVFAFILAATCPAEAASGKGVMAYFEGPSLAPLKASAQYFNQVPTDAFLVSSKGRIRGQPPTAALTFARGQGMQTFATVSNFGATDFSPAIVDAILNSPAAVQALIADALKILPASHYTGVNIDFESVPPGDRAAFTAFARTLTQAMHKAGYLTMFSLPAELKNDPRDSWTGAFDFAALGKNMDIVQLMTYDENGPWGAPGPVAGLDWVTASVQYAVSVIPPAKISLGVPAYGYDWNLTAGTGTTIAWKNVDALLAKTGATPVWDAASSSPSFSYAVGKAQHVVWYKNSRSIPLKTALVVSYGLGGVSVWALGLENQAFWQAVHAGGF